MRIRACLAVAAACWLAGLSSGAGKDLDSLYDDATLRTAQAGYERGLERNYDEVILPRLTAPERRRLADVRIAVPLRGPGNDPFAYYATSPPPAVNLPALSLKFFDDLSVALAWLWANGYGLETPYEYVGMLKYRDAAEFGRRYPPPLDALQIPADALKDAKVAEMAGKIFDSAIGFVLLHELGHIRYGHPGNGPEVPNEVSRANEAEADRFALEIMRRTESEPTGMAYLFMAFVYGTPNRGDYESDAAYAQSLTSATHPLTADRLRLLADGLRDSAADFARNEADAKAGLQAVLYIADQLSGVADSLADPQLQRLIAHQSRETTLAMLAPHRTGEVAAPRPAQPATQGAAAPAFHGTYRGEIGLPDGSVPIETLLERRGDSVTGEYYYGAGRGTLRGKIDGNALVFEWREGADIGHGELRVADDGASFTGSWGFGDSAEGGGTWSGRRTVP